MRGRYRWVIALCTIGAMAWAGQRAGDIRLIVQGDDMGAAHGINIGTIQAYQQGILRTTNVIVTGPWLLQAAKMLEENPGLEVGVHLALTSEWALFKWRPLTHGPSLVDANGYFFPMVVPSKDFPLRATVLGARPKIEDVEKELRAQIELATKLIPRVSYLSTHMGFTQPFPEWQALLRKLSEEYRLQIPGAGIQVIGQVYNSGRDVALDSADVRAEKVAAKLETLGPGTWKMLDHAAADTPEMQAIGHIGYERVAADRAAVLGAWTSPKVLEVVKRRGIKLIGNRDALSESAR